MSVTAFPNDDGTVTVVTPLGQLGDLTEDDVDANPVLSRGEKEFVLSMFVHAQPPDGAGQCRLKG
jgi:hypothetical protein